MCRSFVLYLFVVTTLVYIIVCLILCLHLSQTTSLPVDAGGCILFSHQPMKISASLLLTFRSQFAFNFSYDEHVDSSMVQRIRCYGCVT